MNQQVWGSQGVRLWRIVTDTDAGCYGQQIEYTVTYIPPIPLAALKYNRLKSSKGGGGNIQASREGIPVGGGT